MMIQLVKTEFRYLYFDPKDAFGVRKLSLLNLFEFLIEIIESDRASTKQKLKAQEILQNFNTNTDEFKKAVAKGITANSVYDIGEVIEANNLNTDWDEIPF